ncbi:MAG: SsrA-binding protein SmpB [Phycisphaerales bacterium]|nr:MAG: SsrA-binding protein SmpB [Phycisphaerales bacterium]
MSKKKPDRGLRITNRKARFNFELLERFEAGICLQGTEVKSLRSGQASLEEAYARFQGSELYLINCHIKPYEHGNIMNHEPLRPRKLLLRRREIRKLATRVTQRGLTLVPLQIYFSKRGLAKVELALARGKAAHDKREQIKKRDQEREIRAALKRR